MVTNNYTKTSPKLSRLEGWIPFHSKFSFHTASLYYSILNAAIYDEDTDNAEHSFGYYFRYVTAVNGVRNWRYCHSHLKLGASIMFPLPIVRN
jgi:hypothetical protein